MLGRYSLLLILIKFCLDDFATTVTMIALLFWGLLLLIKPLLTCVAPLLIIDPLGEFIAIIITIIIINVDFFSAMFLAHLFYSLSTSLFQ